jgi:hypothetical protein
MNLRHDFSCRHNLTCPWSSDCLRVVGIITTHTYETAPVFLCLFIPSAVTKSRISLIVGDVLNTIVVHWRKFKRHISSSRFLKLPLESTERPVGGGRYLQLMMRLTLTLATHFKTDCSTETIRYIHHTSNLINFISCITFLPTLICLTFPTTEVNRQRYHANISNMMVLLPLMRICLEFFLITTAQLIDQ